MACCNEVICESLGIDVGKRELHAVLLQDDRTASKSVANSPPGIGQLQTWLKNRKVSRVHACLEATGGYSEDLALTLHAADHIVSLVNPARIKAFAQSEMLRTKTDRVYAASIARFCRMYVPKAWIPPAPEIRTLQRLVRRYHSLVEMRTEEQNRLCAPIVTAPVQASIMATLEHLEHELKRVDQEIAQLFDQHPPLRRQRDLLISIPGIGATTAARILGEMPNIVEFRGVKAVSAFAGFLPSTKSRGQFVGPVVFQKPGTPICVKRCTGRRFRQCVTTLSFGRLRTDCASAGKPT